ncbi:UxaA family hydrolase [Escherichia coli]
MCDVLAAYADHPNVIGMTVFSLGCEKAQQKMFVKDALARRNPELINLRSTFSNRSGTAKSG